jgi:hypothetical protein
MIELNCCAEVNLNSPLDRSLRLVGSKPDGASILEIYFLAENENTNRGSMKIYIILTIDTNGGQRRLTSAHAFLSESNKEPEKVATH